MSILKQRVRRPTTRLGAPKLGRADIQGLRAIAVAAVVLDHLIAWPPGGFVGVDVFFVLSGFLITAQLLKEYDRSGSISFSGFYRRRIKRILPASVFVLVVTSTLSFFVFNLGRASQTFWDAAWALFFSANWHFALSGTDYFQAEGAVSPLQHFWSLAVEEQYYFVWPWLLAIVLALGASRARSSARVAHTLAALAVSAIILGSFFWAMHESIASPTLAYFSTFSRGWELGLGALLAAGSALLARIPSWMRPLLGWIGLAGIVASLFLVNDSSTFPAPWALLPTLSTCLVVLAGIGGSQRFLWPLTNPVSRYIGDISYSLYLWHFPVIIFIGVFFPEQTPVYYGLSVLAMTILSIGSYHLLENPIRKSDWLTVAIQAQDQKGKSRRSGSSTSRRPLRNPSGKSSRSGQYIGLAALMLVVVCLVPLAFKFGSPSVSTVGVEIASAMDTFAPEEGASESDAAEELVAQEITASMSMTEWPAMSPSIDQLGRTSLAPQWVEDGCLANEQGAKSDPYENAAGCVYGDPNAPNHAVVFGDSVGISWMPAIESALGETWQIHVLTMMQCPTATVTVLKNDDSPFPECNAFREWAIAEIAAIRPQLLVLASADTLSRIVDAEDTVAARELWSQGLTTTLSQVAPSSTKTVVLSPPPTGNDLKSCVTPFNRPADCAQGVGQRYRDTVMAEQSVVADLANPTISYEDTHRWFCDIDSMCPAVVGTIPVRADGAHLTREYSATLGAVLSPVLTAVF